MLALPPACLTLSVLLLAFTPLPCSSVCLLPRRRRAGPASCSPQPPLSPCSPHPPLLLPCLPAPSPLCPCRTFLANREAAVDYLNTVERIYVVDGFANWDPEVRRRYSCCCCCCVFAVFAVPAAAGAGADAAAQQSGQCAAEAGIVLEAAHHLPARLLNPTNLTNCCSPGLTRHRGALLAIFFSICVCLLLQLRMKIRIITSRAYHALFMHK